jgi:hypothetical protein
MINYNMSYNNLRQHILYIDSRDRAAGTTTNFTINLPESIRNVDHIELVKATIPQSGLSNAEYHILRIPEFPANAHGSNTILQQAFAVITPEEAYGPTHYTSNRPCPYYFRPVRARINALTLQLLNPDGTVPTLSGGEILYTFAVYTRDNVPRSEKNVY